jgi:SNF2 family DNA or RNA helicase
MSEPNRQKIWNFFECLFQNELNEESTEVTQPPWIQTPLFPHQRTSVQAALRLESAKEGMPAASLPGEPQGGTLFANYGILGDRVGAGKSLIALSLIKYPPPTSRTVEYSWRPNTYHDTSVGLLRTHEATDLSAIPTALFLMPHAIIGQWEEYVKNDTTLKCYFVKKRKDATDDLVERLGEYDAVFVSATMWREFEGIPRIHTILWSRIFIDEADTIMFCASSTDLRGRFIWLISASWMNLVFSGGAYLSLDHSFPPLEASTPYTIKRIGRYISNNYMNIGGIRSPVIRKLCGNVAVSGYNISILNPVLYQATRLIVHNSDEFIQRSFEIPEIQHIHCLCLTPPNIQILRSIVSDDIMERLHAGDAEGVLDVLGIQTKTADQIVGAVTETVQHELDQMRRTYEFRKTMDYTSDAAKAKSLLQYEDRIARLESRIQAIQDRLKHSSEQSCPICFDEVQVPSMTPCCRNLFCFRCICEVLRRAPICPLCRETIPSVQALQVIGGDAEREVVETPRLLTKQEQFRKFLQESPQARVLLFSVYDATFSGLERMLEMEGVTHATLGGSQARIAKLLKQFGEGKYRVLFLNARNMGAGLNIAAATHVVLYHRMPVETKNQIIGRAVRMGRTEPLTVLHLLHGNEMLVREEEGLTQHTNRITHA